MLRPPDVREPSLAGCCGGLAGQEVPSRPEGPHLPGGCGEAAGGGGSGSSSWILARVLKSPRAAPGRLAGAQQPESHL